MESINLVPGQYVILASGQPAQVLKVLPLSVLFRYVDTGRTNDLVELSRAHVSAVVGR